MKEETPKADLVQATAEVIERRALVLGGERVLVAVSGGADSSALLSILYKLSGTIGFELVIGHFDHHLRDTSNVDRRHVEVASAGLGLPFHYGDGDVHARADEYGETIEEAARKLRYQFLFELATTVRADRIATGHTRDDQVETVLMRILRGTGTRGLAGIPMWRGKLIRPLLGLAHLQLVNYCRDSHIAFVEDPLNRDKRFTRNWLRYELLPSIRKYYPSVGENLLRLSRNATDTLRRIRNTTRPLIENNLKDEIAAEPSGGTGDTAAETWTLDLTGISDLDQDAKYVLFGDLLTDYLGHDPDYTRVHFEKLARLSGRSARSGEQLSIPGFNVRREYDTLVFFTGGRPSSPDGADSVVAELPVPGYADFGGYRVECSVVQVEDENSDTTQEYYATAPEPAKSGSNQTPGMAYFALAEVEPPLFIRTPRSGDRMRPFGMKGSKKLSDIFTDKKIPLRRRDKTLVIADQKQILWLIGLATTETTRITTETGKILKITVNPE
jgi:tRNA(Ile)-lysidine synthase